MKAFWYFFQWLTCFHYWNLLWMQLFFLRCIVLTNLNSQLRFLCKIRILLNGFQIFQNVHISIHLTGVRSCFLIIHSCVVHFLINMVYFDTMNFFHEVIFWVFDRFLNIQAIFFYSWTSTKRSVADVFLFVEENQVSFKRVKKRICTLPLNHCSFYFA